MIVSSREIPGRLAPRARFSWVLTSVSSLRARGIDVVLTLPALRANRHDGIYPKSSDGHPNREGYRVIAELAEGSLREGS